MPLARYVILLGVGTLVLGTMLGGFVVIGARALSLEVPESLAAGLPLVFWYLLFFAALLRLGSVHRVELSVLLSPKPSRSEVLRSVMLAPPLLVLAIGTSYLFHYPLSFVAPQVTEYFLDPFLFSVEELEGPMAWLTIGVWSFVVLVLAPTIEEIGFRGFLFGRWSEKWGAVPGALVASALFGMMHFDPVGAFLVGLIFCLVVARTGSLLLVMITHAAYNLLAVGLGMAPGWADTVEAYRQQAWLGLVCLAIGLPWLVWYLRRHWFDPGWRFPRLTPESPTVPQPAAAEALP